MALSGPPDSYIESSQNGMCTDDAGHCEACGQHLDSGRCTCTEEEREAGYQGCTCPIGAEHCTC